MLIVKNELVAIFNFNPCANTSPSGQPSRSPFIVTVCEHLAQSHASAGVERIESIVDSDTATTVQNVTLILSKLKTLHLCREATSLDKINASDAPTLW